MLDGYEANAIEDSRRAQLGNCIRILCADLLARENHMYRASRRLPRLNQHVHPSHVPMLQSKRLNRFRNCVEILTAHHNVDIPSQTPGIRFALFHIQISRQAADDSVLNPRRRKRALYDRRKLEQMLHAFLEKAVDVNRHWRKVSTDRATLKLPVNAVEFHRVSKTYRLYNSPSDRLRELAAFNRRRHHREFQALRDLSFSIRKGEVFCIIGENGSGKSTSLKLMAGIAEPNSGEVAANGRVAALLELGAGFNPEFTGRENAYLNASILGLSHREIDSRYQAIEDFAEIGDFINQPVKTYSSGMVVRLAFAVAISVDPEILIVDEALAVGDAYFRHRCMRKVQELRARGVTIVFVSHSLSDVKAIGDRVLWLRHGEAVALGETDAVVAQYLADMTGQPARAPQLIAAPVDTIPNIDHRHGDGRAAVVGIAVTNEYNEPLHLMMPDSRIVVRIAFTVHQPLESCTAGFVLRNHLGLDFAENTHQTRPLKKGETLTIAFQIDIPELYPGSFSFSPFIKADNEVCDWIDNAVTVQMSRTEQPVYGYFHVPCRVELNGSEASPIA